MTLFHFFFQDEDKDDRKKGLSKLFERYEEQDQDQSQDRMRFREDRRTKSVMGYERKSQRNGNPWRVINEDHSDKNK